MAKAVTRLCGRKRKERVTPFGFTRSSFTTPNSPYRIAAPGTGYDSTLKRGLRHETGGIKWRLPNGTGFKSVEYDDPRATQCAIPPRAIQPPPEPGATIESYFHTHSTNPGEDYYACFDSVNIDGRWVKQPRYVGDPNATP